MGKSNELEALREEAMRRYLTEPVFHAQALTAAQALEGLHVLPDADLETERHRCLSAAIVSLHVAHVAQAELEARPEWPAGLRRRLDRWSREARQREGGSGA